MPKRSTKKSNKRSTKRYRRSCSNALSKPPSRNFLIQHRHVFRFVASNNFGGDISIAEIMGSLGTVCAVANSLVACYNQGFRIKRLEIWASGSATNPAQVDVRWGSGNTTNPAPYSLVGSSTAVTGSFNVPKYISDTSCGTALSAHIDSRPPRGSLASNWIQYTGNGTTQQPLTVFSLNVSDGAVIDLDIEYYEMSVLTENNIDITVATAALGSQYYLALDGPSSNLLVPVGLQTTH